MEDSNFKINYKKYKYKVKMWEKDFKKKNGRVPSKYDIRDASEKVRYAYKMYYQLKTTFLENTLNDILDDDNDSCFNLSFGDEHIDSTEKNESLIDSITILPEFRTSKNTVCSGSSLVNLDSGLGLTNENSSPEADIDTKTNNKKSLQGSTWDTKPIETIKEVKKALPVSKSETSIKNLSSKLLSNVKFEVRNPRKSLSRSQSNIKLNNTGSFEDSENIEKKEELPDFEKLLEEKSLKQDIAIKNQAKPVTSTRSFKNIDAGWLNRCMSEDNLDKSSNKILYDSKNNKTNLGLSNVNLSNIENIDVASVIPRATSSFGFSKLSMMSNSFSGEITSESIQSENTYAVNKSDSDSIVENSEDESSINRRSSRYVVKKRKIVVENATEIIDKGNDCSTKEIDKKKKVPIIRKSTRNKNSSNMKNDISSEENEEPFPCNDSDNDPEFTIDTSKECSQESKIKTKKEKKVNKKSISKRKQVKEKQEELKTDEDEDHYELEFGIEKISNTPRFDINELQKTTELFTNYVNNIKSAPTLENAKNSEVTKENANKLRLEKKMQAGNLNENFVRINMKKKVFVRGKKTINFSRYKKKLWKQQKKVAALSGPDMDMGGCDGGVLTCFQCGQPGHFAQNCKIQGDKLLPIEIAKDESPFLTLEEVEEMSAANAFKAHHYQTEKIPIVNKLLYKDQLKDNKIEETDNSDKPNGSDKVSDHENDESDTDDTIDDSDCHLEGYFLSDNEFDEIKDSDIAQQQNYIGKEIPEDFLKQTGVLEIKNNTEMDSLYRTKIDNSLIETPKEVYDTLNMFGYTEFRPGQEKAIMRILSGLSTLVTLSTGSGKSLCYQLPAYLYKKYKNGITLVISPLVSLMEDQVHGVPSFLNAQCLHTNQTPKQREKIMELIKNNQLDVLLVSPEAIVSGEKSSFNKLLKILPPISFVCIDEAHCVSQWSHNFRPSYLMICHVLQKKLGIKIILGLTATATQTTRESIVNHLNIIDSRNGIISDIPLPNNLILTVSKDINRDSSLINLLQSERFLSCNSIIIYCTRREECERIATLIRTSLQHNKAPNENKSKKRKRNNFNAEPYHAGLPAYRRKSIQNAFMSGDLRIVVATVAFGMGINKSDIRAIIHYNMPSNFESYVQEVGRAGRDNKTANCHLFLDSKGTDLCELKRHIFANSIDRHVIRKLLQMVFIPCSCNKSLTDNNKVSAITQENKMVPKRICAGHEVSFSIESTVQQLDVPEENISTLLCYLELHEKRYLKVLSKAYTMCKVLSYGGPRQLKLAAKTCPPLAMAIAIDLKNGIKHDESTFIEFHVIDIASAIGWDSGIVKSNLKNLEWVPSDSGVHKRSTISVSFFNLGFRVSSPGDLSNDELDESLDLLYNRVKEQEIIKLKQLNSVFNSLTSVAFHSYHSCKTVNFSEEPSDKLKLIIREYFQRSEATLNESDFNEETIIDNSVEQQIISDIRTMINRYPENNFTGRSLARIFHGVQSPNYPAVIWGRCKYWRTHMKINFNHIVKLANTEILKMRS